MINDFLDPIAAVYKLDGLLNPLINKLFSVAFGIVLPSIVGITFIFTIRRYSYNESI